MFETTIGPYSGSVGYGRPEAAQNIFVEFNRLYTAARERLPFGVIAIGHALAQRDFAKARAYSPYENSPFLI